MRKFRVSKRSDIAAFFGVSLGSIDKWRERGMPGEAGAWDLAEIAKWVRSRDAAEAARRKDRESDPDHKLKGYKAEMAKLQLRREKGLLIPLRHHEEYTQRLCVTFRNSILSLGSSLASQLQGLDLAGQNALIRERFRELLEDMIDVRPGKSEKPEEPPPTEVQIIPPGD